ncbi:MAG TPA: hypothetical protein VK468_05905, partial [Pyrinomonadaceae bacterium]|nr:hypothetical protein [Pyrinomonadaceae bacterium]
MLKPHRPQNREFSGSGVEQRGHGNEFGISPGLTSENEWLPQRPQNRTPSANLDPHFAHATMPGIRLELVPLLPVPC